MKRKDSHKGRFLDEFTKCLGVVSVACRKAEVSRGTFYTWLKTDADFKKQVEAVQEEQIDFVESELLKSIKEGNVTAQIFYLKTKGKHRGWTERVEVTGADGRELLKHFDLASLDDGQIKTITELLLTSN